MSLKSAPYWWAVCDMCGVSAQESSEHAAWSESGWAEQTAAGEGWHVEGGNHLCWDCTPPDRDDEDVTP